MTTALLTDFPDALSPMVVKELRQGLRTRLFAGVLLVLHSLMLVITLISGAAENASDVDGMRTSLMVLVLCMILPLRGFSALAGEIQQNTMDMLVLTRLSALRIVFGKWASLAAQLTLVAVSLLPYIVARYLYGAQDLVADMLMLGVYWILGLVITAAVVCLSTQKAFWLRAVVVLMFGFVPFWVGVMFAASMVFGGRGGSSWSSAMWSGSGLFTGSAWWVASAVLVAAAWSVFYFISLAATRVAPPSENLATLKRCVNGGLTLALVLASYIGMPEFLDVALVVLSLATLDALTERNPEMSSIYLPFYRRGLPGRVAAWFLSPGWMSGVGFSFVLAAVVGLRLRSEIGPVDGLLAMFSVVDMWMISALVLISSGRKSRDLLGPWIIIFVIMMVIQSLISTVSLVPAAMSEQTPWGLCLLPGLASSGYELAQTDDQALFFNLSSGIGTLWPLILIVAMVIAARGSRELRKETHALAKGGMAA